MKHGIIFISALLTVVSCGVKSGLTMTPQETLLIDEAADTMRILTIESEADLEVLRSSSVDFSTADLATAEYSKLADKMVKTLENTDGGVGIAAPQVGINRRVVAVQRVDKEGEPIEVYANIGIEQMRGPMEPGPEGCLSVPDRRGDVLRYQDITIRYTDVSGKVVREDVSGFAAVIFQHEADHLDGVLYIDKITEQDD